MVLLTYSASLYKIYFKLIRCIEFIFSTTAHLSDLSFLIVDVKDKQKTFFFANNMFLVRVSLIMQLDHISQDSCVIIGASTNIATGNWWAEVGRNAWQRVPFTCRMVFTAA